jgi:hypothetical protein
MQPHRIVSREEWIEARKALLPRLTPRLTPHFLASACSVAVHEIKSV